MPRSKRVPQTAGTMANLLVFVALLLVLVVVIVEKGVRTFQAPEEQEGQVAVVAGATVSLSDAGAGPVLVADSGTTIRRLVQAERENNTAVRDELVRRGRVWQVPPGTRATIVRTTALAAQVEFADGTSGWVVREAAREN